MRNRVSFDTAAELVLHQLPRLVLPLLRAQQLADALRRVAHQVCNRLHAAEWPRYLVCWPEAESQSPQLSLKVMCPAMSNFSGVSVASFHVRMLVQPGKLDS